MNDNTFTEAEGEQAFNKASKAFHQRRIDAVAKRMEDLLERIEQNEQQKVEADKAIATCNDEIEKLKGGDFSFNTDPFGNLIARGVASVKTGATASYQTINSN